MSDRELRRPAPRQAGRAIPPAGRWRRARPGSPRRRGVPARSARRRGTGPTSSGRSARATGIEWTGGTGSFGPANHDPGEAQVGALKLGPMVQPASASAAPAARTIRNIHPHPGAMRPQNLALLLLASGSIPTRLDNRSLARSAHDRCLSLPHGADRCKGRRRGAAIRHGGASRRRRRVPCQLRRRVRRRAAAVPRRPAASNATEAGSGAAAGSFTVTLTMSPE